jgi:hypothetical protein
MVDFADSVDVRGSVDLEGSTGEVRAGGRTSECLFNIPIGLWRA